MQLNRSYTRVLALAAAVVLAAAACSRGTADDDSASRVDEPSTTEPASGPATNGGLELGLPRRRDELGLAQTKRRDYLQGLFKSYECRSKQCDAEPLAARNALEAEWLKARGFPSADRAEALERMALSELLIAADKGDLPAQAVLGRRLFENGDKVNGRERLFQAAASGSVFADYQLSQAERASNPYESAAYLRRAYLQGDSKAARAMYENFPKFNAMEMANVDNRAMKLYAALLAQRANKGQMRYGPRP